MYQRNYPCDDIVDVYFGIQHNLNDTGRLPFQRQMYQCSLGQALEMKSNIEQRRSANAFGNLVWQFNEIWPTGGWGSVEYGTPAPGQVIGGRWKPLHYFYKQSVFSPLMATCGNDTSCYIRNDKPMAFSGFVKTSIMHFDTGKVSALATLKVSLPAGAAVSQWFCVTGKNRNVNANCGNWNEVFQSVGCARKGRDCILSVAVTDDANNVLVENMVALDIPANMILNKPDITATVQGVNKEGSVDISVVSTEVAVYVTLTTEANGRFSDNVFVLNKSQEKKITFIPFGVLDINKLKSTLRVEHVQLYQ